MPTFTDGSAVLVEDGLRFDLAHVLDACEALIDACAETFGPSIIRTIHEAHAERIPWPHPGKAAFRKLWIEAGKIYDAVCEPIVAVFGPICLKVFPLGTTWCAYREADGALLTPDGSPIDELDPTPGANVYGSEHETNTFNYATPAAVETIGRLLAGPLASRMLRFHASEPCLVSTDMVTLGQFARIAFPHETYGAGRGPIRVRCVRI